MAYVFLLPILMPDMVAGSPGISPFEIIVALGVFGAMGGLGTLSFIGVIVLVYLVYKWIDSLNKHYERIKNMYREAARYLRARGYEDVAKRFEDKLAELEFNVGNRNPVLWAVLVFLINILVWYVLHMLNKNLIKLGNGEYDLYNTLDEIARELNIRESGYAYDEFKKVPNRNTILYIILSILTFGVFMIYWVYAVTIDYNNHIRVHNRVEDKFVKILESIPSKTV